MRHHRQRDEPGRLIRAILNVAQGSRGHGVPRDPTAATDIRARPARSARKVFSYARTHPFIFLVLAPYYSSPDSAPAPSFPPSSFPLNSSISFFPSSPVQPISTFTSIPCCIRSSTTSIAPPPL
jgi:hypothetical protein